MCGIAGLVNFRPEENKQSLIRRMLGQMRHRGPDAAGLFVDGPVGLGHTRLSIIDLNSGNQPICNEDQTVWVTFNGEIFNYPELQKDLKAKGHQFYTKSDTEVLVHLYEEYGCRLFQFLNGQFAFALWDKKRQTLLLGRDRMGIRPLFYSCNANQRLVFGSEIKALLADPAVPRQLDPQSLGDIFTCWTSLGSKSVFEDIFQIPPGCYALFSKEKFSIEPYWTLSFDSEPDKKQTLEQWTGELSDLLLDATRIRLRADVPVGAYLSGGLDSTFISAMIKKKFNNRLSTFSIGFADKRFDETLYQKTAVESLQTDHKLIQCTHEDIGRIFPEVIYHAETPLLRTGPAPLYLLSGLVRRSDFKVVLTGEGADEIFAGYNIFKEDKVRRFWAKHPDSKLRPRLLEKLYPYIFSQGNSKNQRFIEQFFKKDLKATDSPVYSHLLRWQNTHQLHSFFSKPLRAATNTLEQFNTRACAALPPKFFSFEPLSRAQYIESTLFLPNYLLSSQGDRMAMANSIEGRFPFLDHRVVELAGRIPVKMRLNGLEEKFILKQAAKNFIPDQLVKRPKQPYRAPTSQCFFSKSGPDYVAQLLSEKAISQTGYFNPKRVAGLVSKCRKQGGDLLSERENMAMVGILSTQLWDHFFVSDFSAKPAYEENEIQLFSL